MEFIYHLTFILILCMAALWITQRKKIQKDHHISPVTLLLILIAVGIAFQYIPYYWIETGVWASITAIHSFPSLLRALSSAFNAIGMGILEIPRHFALALEYAPVAVTVDGSETEQYFMSQVLLWILAPLGTASFVFMLVSSLFKDTLLKFDHKRPVYYFSSLNEKSFTLANSLYEQTKDLPKKEQPFLIFCQVDVGDESNTELQFSADAEKIGAIFEKDPIHAIAIKDPLRQPVKIFLMDENEDDNILSLLRMEDNIRPITAGNTCISAGSIPQSDIYIFSTHESSELLFDQLLKGFKQVVEASKKEAEKNPDSPRYHYRYNLHLIDETKLVIQKLLLDHPLFEPLFYVPAYDGYTQRDPNADRDDHISVLTIGGGQLGMELVRSAMVCGITNKYQFDIQIIDQNAKELEKQFRYFHSYKHCFDSSAHEDVKAEPKPNAPIELPDIFNEVGGIGANVKPVFHEANCRTTDFDEILEKYCQHSNYIVVATGDDELNISTARYLQRWYARYDIIHRRVPSRPPMIFAAIRNSERYEALKCLEDEIIPGRAKQLFLFGNNEDIFSAEHILRRPLDSSASLFHSCYKDFGTDKIHLDALCTAPDQRQKMRFNVSSLSQIEQFSNQMVALHSLYKLQDLLFASGRPKAILEYRLNPKSTLGDTEFLFHTMAKLIRENSDSLCRLEHRRWNLFQLLDGWECFPMEMIDPCKESGYTSNHKVPLLKLHGCLIPFDDLETLSVKCNKPKDEFKCYDACMCVASVFAWLDLEAGTKKLSVPGKSEPVTHAELIREKLLDAAQKKLQADVRVCTCSELLDLIVETFDPALRIHSSAK